MAGRLAGGGRDRADPAEGSEARFGTQALGVVAGCQQQLRGGLVADTRLRKASIFQGSGATDQSVIVVVPMLMPIFRTYGVPR